MPVNIRDVVEYLCKYIEQYHARFEAFTSPQPQGAGYPRLPISPYLTADSLHCYLTPNGVAVAAYNTSWKRERVHFEGGVLVIQAANLTCATNEALRASGIYPENAYGIGGGKNQPLDQMAMEGNLGPPIESISQCSLGINVIGSSYDIEFTELIRRLTLGAIFGILTPKVPTANDPFWQPWVFTKIGFVTNDLSSERLFDYLELIPHCESAAWDERAIHVRLESDIRRDMARTLSTPPGGTIAPPGVSQWPENHWDRLSRLEQKIRQFKELLETSSDEVESVFHDFLQANPILLDVYGEAISKPRLNYPAGDSPLGKEYVEPDFVIKLPGRKYRFVELERPSKNLATQQGQPRAEVTQATFQIAEWTTFVKKHYETVKDRFPGIAINHTAAVVISRRRIPSKSKDFNEYMELLGEQFKDIEILTYDDVLEKAMAAYQKLATLAVSEPNPLSMPKMLLFPLEKNK